MKKISVLVCILLLSFTCAYSQHIIKPKRVEVKQPPQKPKKVTTPAKPKAWLLSILVTIKGTGTGKDYSGTEFEWDFDRSYKGLIALNQPNPAFDPKWSQAELIEAVNTDRKISWYQDLLAVPLKINAVVKDKTTFLVKEKDEGNTFENTTVVTRSEINNSIIASSDATMLVLDKKLHTYNVVIGFKCKSVTGGCQQKLSTTTSIERSDHGYGDLPASETSTKDTVISFSEFKFPTIKGLLENGKIHHSFDLPRPKMIIGSYVYDEHMIKGVPESKKTVKIHIYYIFGQ
jgi:hypothetical protein